MTAKARTSAAQHSWSVREVEDLIRSLTGVLAARVVTGPDGGIDEIHVLTSEGVSGKQVVRNVESALLAHLDLPVDHRKVSVAHSTQGEIPVPRQEGRITLLTDVPDIPPASAPEPAHDNRVLYQTHRSETEGPNQVRTTVTLAWDGDTYDGASIGSDLPRTRLETAAHATLRAMEAVADAAGMPTLGRQSISLGLDGVKVVEAFDRRFCLVGVHALAGRDILALAGASVANDRLDASVIMATLQATDRWVRGRIE